MSVGAKKLTSGLQFSKFLKESGGGSFADFFCLTVEKLLAQFE